jgi:hypothetical protein
MPPNPIDHLEREQAFSCSLEFFRRALAKRAHAEIEVAEQRRDLSRISQWNTHLHRNTLWTLSCRQPWKTSASRYHRMASSNAAEVDVVARSSAPATTMTSPCGTLSTSASGRLNTNPGSSTAFALSFSYGRLDTVYSNHTRNCGNG